MSQTKIHIQDGGSGVGGGVCTVEQGKRDKTGVCARLNTYTVMMDIIQVMFVCRHHCQN